MHALLALLAFGFGRRVVKVVGRLAVLGDEFSHRFDGGATGRRGELLEPSQPDLAPFFAEGGDYLFDIGWQFDVHFLQGSSGGVRLASALRLLGGELEVGILEGGADVAAGELRNLFDGAICVDHKWD